MGRVQQNFIYIIILILVFLACVYFFVPQKHYEAKGIFLPTYSAKLPAVSKNKVKVYNLRYQSDTVGNIGQIRVSTHVNDETDFQKLCDKNLNKAIQLAADNGAHEIKYVCLYPEGQIDQLSSVSLRAYAFRN